MVFSGAGTTVAHTATLALMQNVELVSGGKLLAPVVDVPFSGGKAIKIASGAALDLGAVDADISLTGVTIDNYTVDPGSAGGVTTSMVSVRVLTPSPALSGRASSRPQAM